MIFLFYIFLFFIASLESSEEKLNLKFIMSPVQWHKEFVENKTTQEQKVLLEHFILHQFKNSLNLDEPMNIELQKKFDKEKSKSFKVAITMLIQISQDLEFNIMQQTNNRLEAFKEVKKFWRYYMNVVNLLNSLSLIKVENNI
ncbi:MAG: hypothetical protein P4L22_05065 [Candidatus Babeliales bacterium]|nr:hypothetical protein [Candidatus Babeliales bacterium]